MSVKYIPYIYGKADKKLVDRVEMARPSNNGILAEWWRVGNAFCTQYENGYYHCYIPEKQYFGIILQHYYINRKGELNKTMIDNHIYPKDSLGITESQYANEERVKQDFSTCQSFYWSDWFDGYDTLVKMIAFCDSVNE